MSVAGFGHPVSENLPTLLDHDSWHETWLALGVGQV